MLGKQESNLGAQNQEINGLAIEELKDFDNEAMRELFQDKGLVEEGEQISTDDFEAIKNRAKVLLQGHKPLSSEAALIKACVDRLRLVEKIGQEKMKTLSEETLRAIFYAERGVDFNNDELKMFKNSPLPMDEWIAEREKIRESLH